MEKQRKNSINKGKICKEPDCNFIAKVKGYCLHCYVKNRYVRVRQIKMTHKKVGVDIKKEEAIQMPTKDTDEDGRRGIVRLGD